MKREYTFMFLVTGELKLNIYCEQTLWFEPSSVNNNVI